MGAYSLDEAKEHLARLVDEALTGEIVTITRDGRPVVVLTPTPPERQPREPRPLTDEYLEGMRKRALARPSLGGDSVTLVREMRDEERELQPRHKFSRLHPIRRRAYGAGVRLARSWRNRN